jgi:hypothetical protein
LPVLAQRDDVELVAICSVQPDLLLKSPGEKEKPEWMKQMAARRHKTLIVCRRCHENLRNRKTNRAFSEIGTGEPYELKSSSTVYAVRRVVISLPEIGEMREGIPGLLAYLEAKAEGDQACQASSAY